MKFSRFLLPATVACLLPLSSCAKSPSGGPVNQIPNRMQVTLTIRGGLNAQNGYYAVAFDDSTARQGPVAIIGASTGASQNKIVGGSFRFVVVYNFNRFTVYRRPDPTSENGELVELSSTPFVGNIAPRATTNSINFTLNLDAKASDGTYYFAHDSSGVLTATSLNINAVATTPPFTSPQDNRIKPVDALGGGTSSPVSVQINSTRTTSIDDDSNDLNDYDESFDNTSTIGYVPRAQLDIQSLDLSVVRS